MTDTPSAVEALAAALGAEGIAVENIPSIGAADQWLPDYEATERVLAALDAAGFTLTRVMIPLDEAQKFRAALGGEVVSTTEPRTAAGQALWLYMEDPANRALYDSIIAIEREAIADFLDHDLPGLLAEALFHTASDCYPTASDHAAALIAAIRSHLAEKEKPG